MAACCSRWKMPPTRPRIGLDCEVEGSARAAVDVPAARQRARRCGAVTAAARPPDGRPHQTIHRVSVRPVSRLDLRAPARLACSPGPCRADDAKRRPRPRAAAAPPPCTASATRNGRDCANFAAATRRARWPGVPTRAAAACWSRPINRRPRTSACSTSPPCRAEVEQRLEQLSAWIVAAHARGERYGLRLAGHSVPPDSGNEHRARCLNGLALHGTR